MGSLAAGVLDALGIPAGLVRDAPNRPSSPVEIGTSGPRPKVSEVGSWQVLLTMLAGVLVLGAVVLMYAVRQRARLVERRRVRRMGEVTALVAATAPGVASLAARPAPATPPRTAPARPERRPPNA